MKKFVKSAVLSALVSALPKKLWDAASFNETASGLIAFFSGEKCHMYDGWHHSCGWSSLSVNRANSYALYVINQAFKNVRINWDNDAPRGGTNGKFFYITKRDYRVVRFVNYLLRCPMILKNLDDAIAELDSLSDSELLEELQFMTALLSGAKLPAKTTKLLIDYLAEIETLARLRGLIGDSSNE